MESGRIRVEAWKRQTNRIISIDFGEISKYDQEGWTVGKITEIKRDENKQNGRVMDAKSK